MAKRNNIKSKIKRKTKQVTKKKRSTISSSSSPAILRSKRIRNFHRPIVDLVVIQKEKQQRQQKKKEEEEIKKNNQTHTRELSLSSSASFEENTDPRRRSIATKNMGTTSSNTRQEQPRKQPQRVGKSIVTRIVDNSIKSDKGNNNNNNTLQPPLVIVGKRYPKRRTTSTNFFHNTISIPAVPVNKKQQGRVHRSRSSNLKTTEVTSKEKFNVLEEREEEDSTISLTIVKRPRRKQHQEPPVAANINATKKKRQQDQNQQHDVLSTSPTAIRPTSKRKRGRSRTDDAEGTSYHHQEGQKQQNEVGTTPSLLTTKRSRSSSSSASFQEHPQHTRSKQQTQQHSAAPSSSSSSVVIPPLSKRKRRRLRNDENVGRSCQQQQEYKQQRAVDTAASLLTTTSSKSSASLSVSFQEEQEHPLSTAALPSPSSLLLSPSKVALLEHSQNPSLSSASLCIQFRYMGHTFTPTFTHQSFDKEWIRGYQPPLHILQAIYSSNNHILQAIHSNSSNSNTLFPTVAVAATDKNKNRSNRNTTTNTISSNNKLLCLHTSHQNHYDTNLCKHELSIIITLSPSCRMCSISVKIDKKAYAPKKLTATLLQAAMRKTAAAAAAAAASSSSDDTNSKHRRRGRQLVTPRKSRILDNGRDYDSTDAASGSNNNRSDHSDNNDSDFVLEESTDDTAAAALSSSCASSDEETVIATTTFSRRGGRLQETETKKNSSPTKKKKKATAKFSFDYDTGKTRGRRMHIDEIIERLHKGLPMPMSITKINHGLKQKILPTLCEDNQNDTNNCLVDVQQDYLTSPIGTVLREYTRQVKNNNSEIKQQGTNAESAASPGREKQLQDKAKHFVLCLADPKIDSTVVPYHSDVQRMARWFIETADDVDISSSEEKNSKNHHYWKVLYVFEKHVVFGTASTYNLVGYMTIFHSRVVPPSLASNNDKNSNDDIVMKICQVLILPPYQRYGHGKEMYKAAYEYAIGSAVPSSSSKKDHNYKEAMNCNSIVEINVEDPAPSFTSLRNRVDYEIFCSTIKDNEDRNTAERAWGIPKRYLGTLIEEDDSDQDILSDSNARRSPRNKSSKQSRAVRKTRKNTEGPPLESDDDFFKPLPDDIACHASSIAKITVKQVQIAVEIYKLSMIHKYLRKTFCDHLQKKLKKPPKHELAKKKEMLLNKYRLMVKNRLENKIYIDKKEENAIASSLTTKTLSVKTSSSNANISNSTNGGTKHSETLVNGTIDRYYSILGFH